MKETKPNKLVAMIVKADKLSPETYSRTEVNIIIARLGDDGKPRNWSHQYEEPHNSTGGCFARIHCYNSSQTGPEGIFSSYGPEICYGSLEQYKHAVRAMQLIDKRYWSYCSTRGPAQDVAESMGRWIEACGVSEVYQANGGEDTSWLNKTDWKVLTIADTIRIVRDCMPAKSEPVAAEQTQAA